MGKELIVNATNLETRLAILEDGQVTEIFIERAKNRGILGNIVKGRVTKVLPGMQAAFVDIGLERNAFLYVTDFHENIDDLEEAFEKEQQAARGKRPAKGRKGGKSPALRGKRGKQVRPVVTTPAQPLDRLPARRAASPDTGLVLPPNLKALNPKQESIASKIERPRRARPEANGILPEFLDPRVKLPRERLEALSAQHGASSKKSESAPAKSRKTRREARVETGSQRPERMSAPRGRSARGNSKGQGGGNGGGGQGGRSRRSSQTPRGGNAENLIGDLLKQGQEILVQVSKEPIGKKGARITSHVALPGRYMVYMPTVDHVGVSRRIVSDKERQRLRRIVMENRGDSGRGFIVRTAGENHDEADLTRDIKYLTRLWEDIKNKAEKAKAPKLIHSEPGLIERVLRDHMSDDFRAVRVDDEQEYARIVEFVSRFNPELVNRVRLYDKNRPIFEEFGVAPEIENALKEKVWLKSGGHIVINQTEALVAVDVNTGKFVGSTNSLEDTITKTNVEAVQEIVRQIRLRDLGGIIIIDFIDMDERKNRQKVMEALQQELARDKSPSKILQFNEFGLVAITRKRAKQSLQRTLCQPCVYCEGTGLTKSVRTICYSIHHEAQKMLRSFGAGQELLIRCHPDVAKALKNGERQVVREIEDLTGKVVNIRTDPQMHIENFAFVEA